MASTWQDFGQRVSLTSRIREILINYPEGTSVIKELVQNADDAGAKTVKLCLDYRSHRTGSVAFEGLADFQGPAFLVYNDATFSEADFESISRIGDSVKRAQAGKTGRFGIGFNAIYHLTDVPMFVSGSHLVMFDPHCLYLPNISTLNPGKRVDFVAGGLAQHHPDQCQPLVAEAWGCDMVHEFQGTLFRFPLRTEAIAAKSQISKQVYTPARIAALLEELRGEVHLLLLFLKCVERVEVLQWREGEREPELLYGCSLRGLTSAVRHERGMFGRVSRAVEAQLAVHKAAPAPGSPGGLASPSASTSHQHPTPARTAEEEEVWARIQQQPLLFSSLPLELETYGGPGSARGEGSAVRRYLVGQGCCGVSTGAWRLAVESSMELGRPLVPWAAVALPICVAQEDDYKGQAFCFLPLPTHTSLPAHINATFELASNRRTLWHGRDMAGAGKRRALWNDALLGDAVAPLLARTLELAARELGPSDAYYRLWPASFASTAAKEEFAALIPPLCKALATAAVAYTSAAGGRWLPPREVLFLDDRSARDERLCDALLAAGLPIASMPLPITRLLLQHLPDAPMLLSPQLARRHVRGRQRSLQLTPHQAAALLEFCMSDLDETDALSTAQLVGLPLLPLANSQVAITVPAEQAGARVVVYVPTTTEAQLFARHACGHLLLDVDLLPGELVQRLHAMASQTQLNLRCIDTAAASTTFLPLLLPPSWKGKQEVAWQPDSSDIPPAQPEAARAAAGAAMAAEQGGQQRSGQPQPPAAAWLRVLWLWLAQQDPGGVASLLANWPVLPTRQGVLLGPKSLNHSPAVMPPGPDSEQWPEGLEAALTKLGCRLVDASLLPGGISLRQVAHSADGRGLLACLAQVLPGRQDLPALFQRLGVTPEERHALRVYLLQLRWFQAGQRQPQGQGEMQPQLMELLRRLPIFTPAVTREGLPDGAAFIDLQGKRFLPPSDLAPGPAWDDILRAPELVRSASPAESTVLGMLGVRQLSKAELYRTYLLPKLAQLQPGNREAVMLEVLHELPQLQRIDGQLVEVLKAAKFVSTASGVLVAPSELHDPRSAELLLLLDPSTDFPSAAFAPVLATLQQLGMKSVAEPATVLRSARSIEAMAAQQPEQAASRGRALLAYLELEAPCLSLAASDGSRAEGRGSGGGPASQLLPFFSRVTGFLRPEDSRSSSPSARAKAASGSAAAFWDQLRSIAWCPILQQPPVAGMPWLQGEQVAAPTTVRPPTDTWLASATMLILDGECRSSLLADALGWSRPLSHTTLSAQLAALGVCHAASNDTSTRQLLASVVPQLYSALAALPDEELAAAKEQLAGAACVWVGNGFMPPDRVAFRGPLNLSPWLYVIPLELAPFKELLGALGVPPSFTPQQFCQVLASMSEESDKHPLSEQHLEQALAIISALADMQLPAQRLFVPDDRGVLAEAGQLVFNDAPWLPGSGEGVRLVHPKISNEVADKLGVASLRRSLLVRGADSIQLGLTGAAMEAFGQSEALTTRLRHIIESYADGPGILMELIQNADDAGATTVAFMLDLTSYPTNSLLGPGMSVWQGPSLCCFNDSEFSPSDLYAISRIGQDSKLGRPAATGRFGLGFNSVYHFTDVPSFVSGDYLVIFDPHAKHLPGVSPAQPGLKINFPGSSLPLQFPDSFAPYSHFGCTMAQHFKGTLFRFPLRTEQTAAASDIKQEAYSVDHVLALFQAFQKDAAAEVLLFLKSVRRVELHVKTDAASPAQLLLAASLDLPPSSPQHPQHAVVQFVKGEAGGGGGGGPAFYQRLAATSDADLPRACSKVAVSLQISPVLAAGSATSQGAAVEGGHSGGAIEAGELQPSTTQIQQWVVCNALGGGVAKRMALDAARGPQGEARSWVPWAGVAALVSPPADLAGRAFCFLPLPALTGLPLHINGGFELSSNRRDLWHGADLAGAGKKRALWNAALLADGVAPAYIQVLLGASAQLGPGDAYYRLWLLAAHLSNPWTLVADRVLDLAMKQPLVWSEASGGRWVAPAEAIFLAPGEADSKGRSNVVRLLLLEGLPLVTGAPPELVQGLLRRHPALKLLSPSFVRRHFHIRDPSSIACLQPAAAPTAEPPTSGDAPLPYSPDLGCLLEYCLSDLNLSAAQPAVVEGVAADLDGLPLLPLLDGSVAVLRTTRSAAPLYIATEAQQRLLAGVAPGVLLAPTAASSLGQQLAALTVALRCNMRLLDVPTLAASFLPRLLPPAWRGQLAVGPFTPGEQGHPSWETLQLLWGAVSDALPQAGASGPPTAQAISTALASLAEFPLVPALAAGTAAASGTMLCAPVAAAQLLEQGSWAEAVGSALTRLGCRLVSPAAGPAVLEGIPGWVRQACIQPATGAGALAAIAAGQPPEGGRGLQAEQLSEDERDALRAFLLQARWLEGGSAGMGPQLLAVLRSLPIFRRACQASSGGGLLGDSSSSSSFTDLASGPHFLAPRSVHSCALPPSFVLASGDVEAELMVKHLGVTRLSRLEVVTQHVIPRLGDLPDAALAEVVLPLVKQMATSPQSIPEAVKLGLQGAACIPTSAGARCQPGQLYDPRSPELQCLLGPSGRFPADGWACQEGVLEGLAALGIRTALGPQVLLEVAKAIEAEAAGLAAGDPVKMEDVVQRGRALLAALATLSAPLSGPAPDASTDSAETAEEQAAEQAGEQAEPDVPASFWSQLSVVSFVPVHTSSPQEGLPWPEGSNLQPVAPPKLVRPESSMWLVSASMRILAAPCPDHLAQHFGWLDRPSVSVLAAQLLELGRAHGHLVDESLMLTLHSTAQELYGLLGSADWVGGQEVDVMRITLEGSPWVWVGEGFRDLTQVALDAPSDFRPYLFTVPEDLMQHEALFLALGVAPTHSLEQYARALAELAAEAGGQPLAEDKLNLATALAECASSAKLTPQAGSRATGQASPVLHLPDAACVMAPAPMLFYDDAPWLDRAGLRMAHPSIAAEVAQALGAQSLRYHHQVDTQLSSQLPCPPVGLIRQLLEQQQDTGLLALWDLVEVADACGCPAVELWLDEVHYPSHSLLHPQLAAFQGPAICAALPGVVLSAEEVCRLLTPTTPFRLRMNQCGYGTGLMASFVLTDLPMVLAGDSLFLADPAGAYLSAPGATGGTPAGVASSLARSPSSSTGLVKQFRHAGSDLPAQFADQFAVWGWAGDGIHSGARVDATLLRLPLRTEAQACLPAAVNKASWSLDNASALLSELAATMPQALLFLRALRAIRVRAHTDTGSQLLHEATYIQPAPPSPAAQQAPALPSQRVWVEEREWKRKATPSSSGSSSSSKGGGGFFGRLARQLAAGAGGSSQQRAEAPPQEGLLRQTQHQVVVRQGDSSPVTQHWAVATCAAAGQSVVNLAAQLQLSPQAAVAVRLDGNDSTVPQQGAEQSPPCVVKAPGLLSPLPLQAGGLSRLPCTLAGFFALARSGGRRLVGIESCGDGSQPTPGQLKPCCNRELLRCVALAWVALLERLLQERRVREMYDMLPRCGPPESCDDVTGFLVQQIYSLAAARPVWLVRGGHLVAVSEGCFLDAGEAGALEGPARDFVQSLFPLFDVPSWVRGQLDACGVPGLKAISPAVVRGLLKRMAGAGQLTAQQFTPRVAADLLRYCMSDLMPAAPDATPVAAAHADAAGAQLSQDVSLQGGQGAAAAAAAAAAPLDLDALTDCRGLPFVTAGGRLRRLGVDRAMMYSSALPVSPLSVFEAFSSVLDDFMHETVAAALHPLLQHQQVASMLQVEQYGIAQVSSHMAAVLPAHWAPPGIGRPAPLSVPWSDGARGGPSPAWLHRLWELLCALQPDSLGPAWDPLAGWALLPYTGGEVARLAYRHMVITPPLVPPPAAPAAAAGSDGSAPPHGAAAEVPSPPAAAEAAGAVGAEGPGFNEAVCFAEPWASQLVPVLAAAGCLVLDPRFALCAPVCNGAYSESGAVPPEEQLLVKKMRATQDLGRLQAAALDTAGRQVLLEWLAACGPVQDGTLRHMDIDLLRSLPIFPTLGGGRVSLHPTPGTRGCIGAASQEDVSAVLGSMAAAPQELKTQLLEQQPSLALLYQRLNVPSLSQPELLVEALQSTGFAGLPAEAQGACVPFMEAHWEELRQSSRGLEVLRTAAFVQTGTGELAAPSTLVDPSHPLLAKIFAGQDQLFPGPRFATPAWLARLRQVGLRQSLDPEAVLTAARAVAEKARRVAASIIAASAEGESPTTGSSAALVLSAGPGQRLGQEAGEVWEAACSLAGCLAEGSAESAALLGGTGSRSFLEELRQVPFVPSRLYSPGSPTWRAAVACYADCLAPKDWALAWSVMPVVHTDDSRAGQGRAGQLPPASAWSALRLRSPPPFDSILQHMKQVGAGHGEAALSAWPSPNLSPEQCCEAVLKYLQDEGLSAGQRQRLEGVAFLPVANATRLASPQELFVRLPVDLAPLLFEVPPEFVPHLALLRSLGTKDAPSPPDLLTLLQSLLHLHASQPLTSIVIRAVVRVLRHLLDDSAAPLAPQTREAVAAGQLPCPTSLSLLAPASRCLYAGSATSRGTVARLASGAVTLAHPLVPADLCAALGMRPLEEVIQEQLDPACALATLPSLQGSAASEVASRLSDARFAAAVHEVLRTAGGSMEAGRSTLPLAECQGRLAQAAAQLQFVEQCCTRLVLVGPGGSSEAGAGAPLEGSSSQVPFFVSADGRHFVVAQLPAGVPLSAALAAATTRLLLGDGAPCLPLAPLFECDPGALCQVASVITGTGGARSAAQLEGGQGVLAPDLQSSAGQLGAPLTPTDASALHLRPLRPYAAGELVAYQGATGQLQLRYGRVAADSRPPPGAPAYRVTVEVEPSVFQDLLSSQLYSFGEECSAGSPGVAGEQPADMGALPGASRLPHSPSSAPQQQQQQQAQQQQPSGAGMGQSRPQPQQAPLLGSVPAAELVAAAHSMLSMAGVPMSANQAELAAEVAQLQQQLQQAQQQLVKAKEERQQFEEQADSLRTSWQCRICLTHEVNSAMGSCGHLLCNACAAALPRQNTCPFCRRAGQVVRIFK